MDPKEVVGAILGALLGFWAAYFMFRIQRRSDRKEVARRDAVEKMATYDFAREQLAQAQKRWVKEEGSLREFAQQYADDPFIDHPHTISVNPALRSLELLDRKELRLALNHHCGEKAGARLFRAMVAIMDYYHALQEAAFQSLLAGKNAIYQEKLRFDDLYADLGNTITTTIQSLHHRFGKNVPTADQLNKILADFYGQGHSFRGTVDDLMKGLVQPCLNLVMDQSLPHFYINDVLTSAKRAQKSYLRIRYSAEEVEASAKEWADQMKWMQRFVLKVLEILGRPKGK